MSQATKNLRQAMLGLSTDFGAPAWEAMQAAARWAERPTPDVGAILERLDLAALARACLVDSVPLEVAGECGPYATASQRRAWAAGRLCAAAFAIHAAEAMLAEQKAAHEREAALQRKVDRLLVENRAAWRASKVDVPFKEPPPRSVDWSVAG